MIFAGRRRPTPPDPIPALAARSTCVPTVVVCTANASGELPTTLDGIDADAHADAVIVVVRSGRTAQDPIEPELSDWIACHPARRLSVVDVAELGASVARRTGLEASPTDEVLFADDDVSVCPGWYDALADGLSSGAGAVGGTIVVRWPHGRPAWLPRQLNTYYGERAPGLGTEHLPFGANVAVRKSVVHEVGDFRAALGHRGERPGLHEETELFARMIAAGHEVRDAPDAKVEHRVRENQVRVRWVLRRAWYEGVSDALVYPAFGSSRLRPLKLGALLLVWVPALINPRWAVHVTTRIIVNAGFYKERVFGGRSGTTQSPRRSWRVGPQ